MSFFKGHIPCLSLIHARSKKKLSIQIPAICTGEEGVGVGVVQKNNKQTLENKEVLEAAALLLNISQYRENGEDSSLIFPRQQNKERLNNHTTYIQTTYKNSRGLFSVFV